MTETEMLQMPKYVAENRRCACPEDDCNYVTVDTFMLVSFFKTRPCPFIQILSGFYPDFIQILSR